MQIDLSKVSNTKGHHHVSPYWNRREASTASYEAKRLDGERFVIFRFPKDGAEYILLGQCVGEDLAERRIDWWVANDHRVRARIERAARYGVGFDLLDIILESAKVK